MSLEKNSNIIWILESDRGQQLKYQQLLEDVCTIRFFDSLEGFRSFFSNNTDESPYLLIAELNLSDGSFLNFLTLEEKGLQRSFPFIIVTGVDDIENIRLCYEEGALDYLVKPVNQNELTYKIELILKSDRRIKRKIRPSVRLDGLEIAGLTSKQTQLLSLFITSNERKINRTDILNKVWDSNNVHPKTIDVHLYNLRRKLDPFGYIIRSEGGGAWSLISNKK
ncbi:MAG: DNA-binding response OmpR family regulator [Bacteriovoracaceae bacterium]|jgi:DNA-binding response OmpR family regulator